MEMKTGFYSLSKLDNDKLKAFFKDAVDLSYDSHIDILDCSKSFRREQCTTKTIQEMVDNANTKHHNVCIDRSVQSDTSQYGEIGYCTITKEPDYFLYIFVTLENLQVLVDKYNLIMK